MFLVSSYPDYHSANPNNAKMNLRNITQSREAALITTEKALLAGKNWHKALICVVFVTITTSQYVLKPPTVLQQILDHVK